MKRPEAGRVADIGGRAGEPSSGPLRIALVGAECSGKTTLGRALAARLRAVWVGELLREFCDLRGRTPTCDEQHALMGAQIEREQAALEQARREGAALVICDSTPLVTALYSVELFADETLLGRGMEHQRGYAATLFTAIDLPWEADGIQRDGPLARASFHARLARTLESGGIGFTPIAGTPELRLARALEALRASAHAL